MIKRLKRLWQTIKPVDKVDVGMRLVGATLIGVTSYFFVINLYGVGVPVASFTRLFLCALAIGAASLSILGTYYYRKAIQVDNDSTSNLTQQSRDKE